MHPKVVVIVLNYNGLEDTIECLDSLKAVTYPNYEVVLVDNHSDNDGDIRVLEDRYRGCAKVVRCRQNNGFGAGNNRGIKYALDRIKVDYFLLLNNDVVVDPSFIEGLVDSIESTPRAGAAVAKILLYDDKDRIEAAGNHIDMWRGQNFRLAWMRRDNGHYDTVKELNSASINGFLVSSKVVWDVGLFDEDYFIYMDDADYCTRIVKKGYKILYAPRAKIWHKVGVVTRRVTGLSQYYIARNNFRFMRNNATKWQYRFFLAYFIGFHIGLMSVVYLLYFRRPRILWMFYKGVVDGFRNISGRVIL